MRGITVYADRQNPAQGRVLLEVGASRFVKLIVGPVEVEITPAQARLLAQHLQSLAQHAADNQLAPCPSCGRTYATGDGQIVCGVCEEEDATGVRR